MATMLNNKSENSASITIRIVLEIQNKNKKTTKLMEPSKKKKGWMPFVIINI